MPNIIDYIKWRGDLTFEKDSFNEIDNMAFERLSYFPLEKLMKQDETVSIGELSKRFLKEDINELPIIWDADIELFPLMGKNLRYSNIKVSDFEFKYDRKTEEQFAAVTIHLSDEIIYISYRGTDCSIVGWKEDFNLGFMSHIGAQVSAKKYLNRIANKYPDKEIILGGHSKGGNIAIYAAVFADEDVKKRIIKVYNNEGPGFENSIVESDEYKEMSDRMVTYIPQNSIIGMVMNHNEKIIIVKSNEKGIMQHDIYSWEVERDKLVRQRRITRESVFIDKTISGWLQEVEQDRRKAVIDASFDLLYKTDVNTFKELKLNKMDNAITIMRSYRNLDSETKKMMIETLKIFARIAKDNVNELLG